MCFSTSCLYLEFWSLQTVKNTANPNYGYLRGRKEKIKHLRLILLWQATVSTRGTLCWFKHVARNFPCLKNLQTKWTREDEGGTGPARWRVMLCGRPERCKTWLLSFQVYSLEKQDFSHKESIFKHSYLFPPWPLPPSILVKASHSFLEMLICSQKSPGEYPTALIPALQKHPGKTTHSGWNHSSYY